MVRIGVSVAGIEDTHKMRGVQAPGVWAHAMALDNIITFCSDYHHVNFGLGLNPDVQYVTLITIFANHSYQYLLHLFLHLCAKKDTIENFIDNRIPRYLHEATSKL